ncbi:MAG: flagellar hook-basal body complex protein [Oscillospiraceae bacterium]|nr:flagellar hook-basal body complex protein [Oscillospiraceae bacterium]
MLRGYYTSVNGIINEERILNIITNNLSNTNTAGYKSDAAIPTTFHDNLLLLANGKRSDTGTIRYRTLIETKTDLVSGTFEQTNSRLDMAVMGSVYFNIQRRNSGEVLLTRNGQFNIDNEGYLALGSAGRVIDENGEPIMLGTADFKVREDGLIEVDDGREIQLALTFIPDNADIEKVDTNLMRPYEDLGWGNIPEGMVYRIRQGWYERSNVNIAAEMAKAMDANALFRANSQALQIVNSVNQLAVNNLMKV